MCRILLPFRGALRMDSCPLPGMSGDRGTARGAATQGAAGRGISSTVTNDANPGPLPGNAVWLHELAYPFQPPTSGVQRLYCGGMMQRPGTLHARGANSGRMCWLQGGRGLRHRCRWRLTDRRTVFNAAQYTPATGCLWWALLQLARQGSPGCAAMGAPLRGAIRTGSSSGANGGDGQPEREAIVPDRTTSLKPHAGTEPAEDSGHHHPVRFDRHGSGS